MGQGRAGQDRHAVQKTTHGAWRKAAGMLAWLVPIFFATVSPSSDVKPPAGGFEVTYRWTERSGPLTFTKEVHVYGNGQLRWVVRSGLGPAREFTPPRDRALAAELRKVLGGKLPKAQAPCGSPRPGELLFRGTGRKARRIPLWQAQSWQSHGGLAERLLERVLRLQPPRLDGRCRPLLFGLEPGRKPRKPPWIRRKPDTETLLRRFSKATDEEGRLGALTGLAWSQGEDPFFRFELLRQFPTRRPTRALLQAGVPALVRSARTEDAKMLLARLVHRKDPDALFQSALLLAALGRLGDSVAKAASFWRAVLPDGKLKPVLRRLGRIRKAAGVLLHGAPTWGADKRAHAAIFRYLHDLLSWSGLWPPASTDDGAGDATVPLLLAHRALHHARIAYFWRGPRPRTGAAAARAFLLEAYAFFAQGDWSGLPPVWKMDLVYLTGYLRKNPGTYRHTAFAGPLPVRQSVVRLIEMARDEMARRFLDRKTPPGSKGRAELLLAAGRAYRRMEAWDFADWAFQEAAKAGSTDAAFEEICTALERGDVARAAALTASLGPVLDPAQAAAVEAVAAWMRGQWQKAATKAAQAARTVSRPDLQLLAGRALASLGRLDEAASLLEGVCRKPSRQAASACAVLGEMALAANRQEALDRAATSLEALGASGRGCGLALRAAWQAQKGAKSLASLLTRQASFRAGRHPEALLCAAGVLARHHLALPLAMGMVERALALRPGWSQAEALLARLFLEGGRAREAYQHALAAVNRRPGRLAYRALLAAARSRLGLLPGGVP